MPVLPRFTHHLSGAVAVSWLYRAPRTLRGGRDYAGDTTHL